MILSSFCIIFTRPFNSSLVLCYKWSIVTVRLSCTVMEIWRLKDNGVTSLTFWGHVTSSVTKERWKKGKKEKGGGEGRERENGRGKGRGRRNGKEVKEKVNENGKGKGKEKGEGGRVRKKGWRRGREEGRKMRKGKGERTRGKEKGKGEEKRKEKGKGKGRWKEDSFKNVGRTDARKDGHKGDFILCSMLCIALEWTDNNFIQ